MNIDDLVFVGIKGTAMALARQTGEIVWRTKLKSSEFVNLVLAGDHLYATTHGEMFCLNPADGQIVWNNPLRGCGWGLASIAVRGGMDCGATALMAAEERVREEQARSGSAGTTS